MERVRWSGAGKSEHIERSYAGCCPREKANFLLGLFPGLLPTLALAAIFCMKIGLITVD